MDADATSKTELVLDLVLSYLPTRDCVKTSILSSKWRYRWTTIPVLVFNNTLSLVGDTRDRGQALASIINRVLALHTGSIHVFEVRGARIVPDIDCWILCVSKGSLQTLVLRVWGRERYKLHSSVYNCGSLIRLELACCELRPPSSFKGFKNLKCLYLDYVALNDDVLENLISSCPLLEDLTLIEFEGIDDLKIDAQNLKVLYISGSFKSISLGQTLSRLLEISIIEDSGRSVNGETSLTKFLINIPSIQRFELGYGLLGCLAAGSIPEELPFQYKDLHYIAVDTNLGIMDECMATLFLFKNSPNLRGLRLQLWEPDLEGTSVWADKSKCNWEFERLHSVTIDRFHGNSAELDFVKFLLENSPVLEYLTIVPHSDMPWKVVRCIYMASSEHLLV